MQRNPELKTMYAPTPPRDRIFIFSTVLYIFNVILFLSALISMTIAAWILSSTAYLTALLTINKENVQHSDVPSLLQQSSFVLVIIGLLLFIISIIGVAATHAEQVRLIRSYAITMAVVIMVETAIPTIIVIYKERLESKLRDSLMKSIEKEYMGEFNATVRFTLSLDWAMVNYNCCGVDGYQDFNKAKQWLKNIASKGKDINLPETCCKFKDISFFPTAPDKLALQDRKCPVFPTATNSWMNVGCLKKLEDISKRYVITIIVFGSILLLIQIIGIVFSTLLAHFIAQRDKLYMDLQKGHLEVLKK